MVGRNLTIFFCQDLARCRESAITSRAPQSLTDRLDRIMIATTVKAVAKQRRSERCRKHKKCPSWKRSHLAESELDSITENIARLSNAHIAGNLSSYA